MHNPAMRKKRTIFQQFVVAFLGIVSPIVLFGVLLILLQTNIIQKEIEKKAENDAYYKMMYLSDQISMVENQHDNLVDANEIQKFIQYYNKVPVYEYYTLVNEVERRMRIEKEANECIEDISIYFKDSDISISLRTGYSHAIKDQYKEMSDNWSGRRIISFGEDEIYMILKHPLFASEDESKYIIKISLSKEYLFQNYILNDTESEAYLFLYDHTGEQLLYMPREGIDAAAEVLRTHLAEGKQIQRITFQGHRYLVMSRYSKELNLSLYQCVSLSQIVQVQNRFYGLLTAYLVLSILFAVLFLYSVKYIVNRPIYQLIEAFRDVEEGDLNRQISYHAADEFNYLYGEFNHMVRHLGQLIDENYKSKLYAQRAELKQMQAQISPHFLYNTYFMLHRMIQDEDLEYAARLSKHLGIFMEYITHNSQEEVFLENEAEHAGSYLEIQAMRFGDRMHVHMQELPKKLAKVAVPRLILQPVVENYLKYGYEEAGGEGDFFIVYEEQEKGFSIVVSGGCAYITEQKYEELVKRLESEENTVEVTGLINIHRRLKIRFGPGSGIRLERDRQGRLITKLIINDGEEEACTEY